MSEFNNVRSLYTFEFRLRLTNQQITFCLVTAQTAIHPAIAHEPIIGAESFRIFTYTFVPFAYLHRTLRLRYDLI